MRRIALATLLALSCSTKPKAADPQSAPITAATVGPIVPAAPPPDPGLPPLESPEKDKWTLEDGTEIFAAIPGEIREKRPVIVGIHGASDRPEWACAKWSATVAGYAFVVCPKGLPWWPHQAWGAPSLVAERADLAIAELRARHGAYVADGPVVY